MGRIYIKVFLGFWLVILTMLVGTNGLTHWLGMGSDKHLSNLDSDHYKTPGGRLLQEMVSDAINTDLLDVKKGLKDLPSWASRYILVVNEQGQELIQRPIPADVQTFISKITSDTPRYSEVINGIHYHGRKFRLVDGVKLRLVVFPPNNNVLSWRLFINNLWYLLLFDALISGAICLLLAKFITRDMNALKSATQRIARGELNVRIRPYFKGRTGELAKLASAFDDMAAKLQKSMAEQKRLIKDVSHELRTPLARIQVALGIAQQRADPEMGKQLQHIKQSADYLNEIISDILSMPVTEDNNWELTDVIELSSLLKTTVNACRDEAREKNLSLKLDMGSEETLIQTRGNTILGVFDNIIRNAIRYTASDTKVTIKLKSIEDNRVQVSVRDSGPGIKDEYLEDIFEPFFRTDWARDRQSGGYGLGLAIAKRTVELHKGEIVAENNPGQGLTIIVTLPTLEDLA